ncbi:hypothetical protein [Streptomyces sp. NPDC040750]|uniref:hypothetical protein n=1 Tax=Streptomyces sp. NPDC040750 TaxID=3154491 RepID=UPI00340CA7E1
MSTSIRNEAEQTPEQTSEQDHQHKCCMRNFRFLRGLAMAGKMVGKGIKVVGRLVLIFHFLEQHFGDLW